MKDGWRTVTIGKLCDEGGGSVQTGPFGSQLHASDYVVDGIPFIMPANLGENKVIENDIARISNADYQRLAKYQLKQGDIIYGRRGDIGRRALITKREEGWMLGSGCLRIRFGDADVDPRYVSYYLGLPEVKQQVLGKAVGTTMPNLNSAIIRSVPLTLPPLPIQRRIASILGALDDKIECNRRINQTLEQMAQALYKHWFVDFAPFRDGGMVETELGEVPRGWRVGKFGDIAVNPRVGADPRKLASDTPYIGLEHMPRQTIALDDWGSSSQVTSNKWAFQRKQILFGKLRPYFHKVGIAPIDGVCSSDILVIEPSQRAYFGMTLCVVSNAEFVNYTSAASGGTRMPRTSWEQMTRYPVAIPTEEIAARFNQQIDLWAEQIITNIIENRSLARTRDYLLPKLMSGEIEIKNLEQQTENLT
jgi:type I restriction enzyme S subunit